MYLLICLMAILITHGSRLYLEQVLATTHLKQASLKVVGRIPLIDGLVRLDGVWLHSIFAPDPRRKWWWFPRAAVVHIRTWESMCWRRRSRRGAVEVGKSSGRKTLRVGKLTSSSRLLHGIVLFLGPTSWNDDMGSEMVSQTGLNVTWHSPQKVLKMIFPLGGDPIPSLRKMRGRRAGGGVFPLRLKLFEGLTSFDIWHQTGIACETSVRILKFVALCCFGSQISFHFRCRWLHAWSDHLNRMTTWVILFSQRGPLRHFLTSSPLPKIHTDPAK